MPLPNQLKEFDIPIVVTAGATITAGFTVAVTSPTRGEIIGVYVNPIDDSAVGGTGPGTVTLTVANVAGATVSCTKPSGAGFGSGTTALSGTTLSARQFVNDGEVIKAVFTPGGLTSAANGVLTLVVRARSL